VDLVGGKFVEADAWEKMKTMVKSKSLFPFQGQAGDNQEDAHSCQRGGTRPVGK